MINLTCNFDFCIYNQDNMCRIGSIHINAYGMCDDCILVMIDDEDLDTMKRKQLWRFEGDYYS